MKACLNLSKFYKTIQLYNIIIKISYYEHKQKTTILIVAQFIKYGLFNFNWL